jgi:hypothetical protein
MQDNRGAKTMPQLVRGGKWVFGWVIVGPQGELPIPPEAWHEYGFRPGEEAAFLPGSRTSGGFGLSTSRLLADAAGPLRTRIRARSRIGKDAQLVVAAAVLGVDPGDRLLVVRGSGQALGFVARGPIFDEALKHPELEVFCTKASASKPNSARS